MFGFKLEDYGDEDEIFTVWEENDKSVQVFLAMRTQKRYTSGWLVGFDYSALPFVFSCTGIKRSERADIFRDLQIMEDEMLTIFREENGRRESQH